MSDEEVGDVNKTFGNKYLYIREKKKKVERNMGTFSAIIIEEQPRKKVCLSFLLYTFGLMASCVSQKLNVKLLYTDQKIIVLNNIITCLNSFKFIQNSSNLFQFNDGGRSPDVKYNMTHDNKLCLRYLQFLWDTLLCIERKHLPWEKPSALTSFNSSHFLSPHLNNQNFPRGPFFRQNLLLSDLTLDYQLSTPIITIQHWWEIILDVCFFMNEGLRVFIFGLLYSSFDVIWY